MPEEGRSSDPLGSPTGPASTALQLRRDTELSTLLFPSEVATAAAEEGVHFRDLWHVVVKRKWSILAVFLIVVVATAVGTLMQTPLYRAEITLKIDSEASKIIPFRDGVQFDTGDPGLLPDAARAAEEPHARRARGRADEAEAAPW